VWADNQSGPHSQRNGTTKPVYPQTAPGDLACRFTFNEQVHLPATLYKVKPPEPPAPTQKNTAPPLLIDVLSCTRLTGGRSRLSGGGGAWNGMVRVQEVGLENAPFRPAGAGGLGHSGLSGQFRKKCVVLSVVECGESTRSNQVRACVVQRMLPLPPLQAVW
jgi:hypothetical protein